MHETSRANGPKERCKWAQVDWNHARRVVKNLRQRIFRATSEGDLKKVRSLRRVTAHSIREISSLLPWKAARGSGIRILYVRRSVATEQSATDAR